MLLRRARAEDAPALLTVKQALKLSPNRQPQRGGFLLGTTVEQYRHFIAHDWVLVAENAAGIVGFAVVLAQATLAQSEVWKKREAVRLTAPPLSFGARLAYFEQLAFLPSPEGRTYAKYVSFLSAKRALEQHDGLLATVVQKPFHNRAVLPFLEVTGFKHVGEIDEDYPEVERIVSDVFYLDKADFLERLETPAFKRFLPKAEAQLAVIDRVFDELS